MNHVASNCLALIFGTLLSAVALSAAANASSLRQGSSSAGAGVTSGGPGVVLWGWYDTQSILDGRVEGGDEIIRLANPVGSANPLVTGAPPAGNLSPIGCAMIYVFDDDQEMGECCGCPLTPTQLATFSVRHNLTDNWGISSPLEGRDNPTGAVAIVAAEPNLVPVTPNDSDPNGCSIVNADGDLLPACHGGCNPAPLGNGALGYSPTGSRNFLGSITHNQFVGETTGLTEVPLFDDAGGDPTNLVYLQNQCGALVGNATGGGICNCPTE
jgi:hypothetical protein